MKNKFILLNLLSAFIVFLSAACQDRASKNEHVLKVDSVKKDIPANKNNKTWHLMKEKEERLAGLEDLEQGYDGIQMRIWFTYSSLRQHLIILKKRTNREWEGSINTLDYRYKYTGEEYPIPKENPLIAIDKNTEKVEPRSGWKSFIDSLFELKILTLPDMTLIPGYGIGMDGKATMIEIATPSIYRVYHYYEPATFADKLWQAKNADAIGKLIEAELGFIPLSNSRSIQQK